MRQGFVCVGMTVCLLSDLRGDGPQLCYKKRHLPLVWSQETSWRRPLVGTVEGGDSKHRTQALEGRGWGWRRLAQRERAGALGEEGPLLWTHGAGRLRQPALRTWLRTTHFLLAFGGWPVLCLTFLEKDESLNLLHRISYSVS